MVANWNCVISELRSKALSRGLILPERPVANSRWHTCDVAGRGRNGAYLLFATLPYCALFTNDSDGRGPEVWRFDNQRLLSMDQQKRIADAITACPLRPAFASGHDPLSRAATGSMPTPALIPQCALVKAQAFLTTVLAAGPTSVIQIQTSAATAGVSSMTLRRAKQVLNVEAVRTGFGRHGEWRWRLP
jgi:hypothetical protein